MKREKYPLVKATQQKEREVTSCSAEKARSDLAGRLLSKIVEK
jgi:hypothetical protein